MPGAEIKDKKVRNAIVELISLSLGTHKKQWKASKRDNQPDVPSGSDYCGVCHKVTMPEKYTGGKKLSLGDTHTPWLHSHLGTIDVSCIDCHFQFVADYENKTIINSIMGGGVRDHKSSALNQSLLELLSYDNPSDREVLLAERKELEKRILGGIQLSVLDEFFFYNLPYMFDLKASIEYIRTPPLQLRLGYETGPVPGNRFRFSVFSKNTTGAHHIPTGLMDLINLWMEVKVIDAQGKTVYHSGFLDEEDRVDPNASQLGATLFDENGDTIIDHRFWRIKSAKVRSIAIGEELEDTYEILVPEGAMLPLTIDATWKYRRYKPEVASTIFKTNVTFPISVISTSTWKNIT